MFVTASHSILAIIGFAEITIAITHCVYCCITIYGPFKNEDAEMVSISMCIVQYVLRHILNIRGNLYCIYINACQGRTQGGLGLKPPLSWIFYKTLLSVQRKLIVFAYFLLAICRLNANTTE